MKNYFNLANYFYDVSNLYKDEIALRYNNKEITYDQLNKLSNQIAHYFLYKGIRAYDVVGIFNTKEYIGYACMLACLKIGATYTNIDRENPIKRLEKILITSETKLLVSDHSSSELISNAAKNLNLELIDLTNDKIFDSFDKFDLEVSTNIIGSTPAYIMFTSGSTGIPKGVTISHANILSFLGWSIDRYKINYNDIFAQVSPMYFDNSVFDFYTSLFSGASLVPIKKEVTTNIPELIDLVDSLNCFPF